MTSPQRILAIDPSPRGFGYAVLEGSTRLVDWGLVHVSGGDKNSASLHRVVVLMRLYRPDSLALEDCDSPSCRRRARTRALITAIMADASSRGVRVCSVAWGVACNAVLGTPRAKKEAAAFAVARRFPELADRLPPHRKAWMSEDPRMSLFDAIALGLGAQAAPRDAPPYGPTPTSGGLFAGAPQRLA